MLEQQHSLALYHAPVSTCSQRVRMGLIEKGLSWEDRQLSLAKQEHLSPAFLQINPNGLVPALVHNGLVVADSTVILEYLEDVFPNVPLRPTDPHERARMRMWQQYIDEVPNNRIYASACPADSYQFCPRCAEEDLDFHGVSYWRRAHLLPGVDHCSKHSVSLVIAKHMKSLICQPAYAEVVRAAIAEDESEQYFSSAFIHRFTVLSDLALQARAPLSPAVITRILLSRSNTLLGTERSILTKTVIEKFPASWLKRHFPLIFKKPTGARFSAVDEVLRSSRNAYRTKLYLLAMSLLWDDPDDAINACLQEATVHTSGFHESGANLALKDVLMGESINKSCRRYGVHLRDFEFAFQKFLEDIRPVAHSYATRLLTPTEN